MASPSLVGKAFNPKDVVIVSGIYECTVCSTRVMFNKGLRFGPAHCLNAKWRLVEVLPSDEVPRFEQTLKNLLTAYAGESNACVRYAAFAEKADAEGYQRVGSLFRAASRAEKIHASNHAEVIQLLGGVPDRLIVPPEIMTTEENLQAAVAGELYEVNTMYADFIKEATESKNADALHTFNLALEVEKIHAKLFNSAVVWLQIDRERLASKGLYYVCPKCGNTLERFDFDSCPNCGSWTERFELVA